jgi:uncharacterized OsmC-like protein
MEALPHRYSVAASVMPGATVQVTSDGLRALETGLPAQFGGDGDHWSPETLLVGAVADCLALTFRGVARARKLTWTSFWCETDGRLDRVDGGLCFTDIDLHVRVSAPAGVREDELRSAIEKAERTCLITNSLKATVRLDAEVVIDEPAGVLTGA